MSQMNFRRLFSTENEDNSKRDWLFGKLKEKDDKFIELVSSFDHLLPDSYE